MSHRLLNSAVALRFPLLLMWLLLLSSLLLCPFISAVFAGDFPLAIQFDDVKSVKEKHDSYGMLNERNTHHFGEYWERRISFGKKLSASERLTSIRATILQELDNPALSFDKHGFLTFEHEGEEYVMQLRAYAKSATVTLLKSGSYRPFLNIGQSTWSLSPKLTKKVGDVPKPGVAPAADELEVTRLQYQKYDEKQFRAGKQTLSGKGKYWKIQYTLKKYTKHNALRYRASHDYRALLAKQGATISPDDDSGFIFALDYEGKHYVGNFTAYDKSFELEVIEEEAFSQSLVLSPDKLKAELDADGKVTLQGIYFDTDKATLKKESDSAVLAAAALLKHYSDLVLEVQGHTDSQGDDNYNRDLSARRAAAVVNALVAEGVEKDRLSAKGFGETVPIADNATEEGRARNRRVELHRLRGGDEVMMLSIDFIKPLPGARLEARRHYEGGELLVLHSPPYADKKSKETIVASSSNVYTYEMERNGHRDTSYSPVEILANYRNILPMLGAQLLGEDAERLYFTFADRGDNIPLYGVIAAYHGTYKVSVYTLGSPGSPAVKTPAAEKMIRETAGCGKAVVGDWKADYEDSRPYNTDHSYAFITNGVIEGGSDRITIRSDGSARMEGSKEGYDLQWEIKQGVVLLLHEGQTVRELKCPDGATLTNSMEIVEKEPTVVLYRRSTKG